MEILNIFRNDHKTIVKNPSRTFLQTLNLSLSIVYISYFYVYLSAVDFAVVIRIYSIDFDPVLAESVLQSITGIGGLLGAFTPVLFVCKLSRR